MTKKRQCTVVIRGRRCPNAALPNKRTCGKHGKRASRSTGSQRTRFVHLDCRVPDLLADLEPINTADEVTIEVRDNGAIIGLPTNQPQMLLFLREWLRKPGHSLDLLEKLTPPALRPEPLMANAYAHTSDRLVRYDLARGGAA